MTRCGFAKVLKSNESGWSGNKPNQRGKFIIVPKSFYSIFPELSRLILNDQKTIKCITLDKKVIGLNIVYHNAKFFPETHNRDHDEVRIYRNSDIDDALELEKDKLVVFLPISKNNDYTYCVFCLCESDPEFNKWNKYLRQPFLVSQVEDSNYVKRAQTIFKEEYSSVTVQNFNTITQEIFERSKTSNSRQQQPSAENDPATPLKSLIKNQPEFAKYLHEIYDYKCAIRKSSLIISSSCVGLHAAHIQGHADGGPLLPTNGFLLSADLHSAFDRGAFTLSTSNCVEVNPLIPKNSEIWQFHGRKVCPSSNYEIYSPFSAYVSHHRNNVFQKYEP